MTQELSDTALQILRSLKKPCEIDLRDCILTSVRQLDLEMTFAAMVKDMFPMKQFETLSLEELEEVWSTVSAWLYLEERRLKRQAGAEDEASDTIIQGPWR